MNARGLLLAATSAVLLLPLGCGLPGVGVPGLSKGGGAAETASSAARPAAKSQDALPAPSTPPEGRRVQRSAQLTLQVGNGAFDSSWDRVTSLMQSQGGYVSGSQAQADGSDRLRSGVVTFQVPSDRFDATIAGLRRLGKAESIQITGTDVSSQYVDLQARLRNAEAQRDAMLALLQQAKSVNDILQVQNQLGQITAQIEQLKGQIDYLDHSTSYATVAVTIREAAAASSADQWGLQTALVRALHNSVDVVGLMLMVVGALAPLLLLGLAGLLVWRFRRRPRAVQSST
jgi:Domain of unknown function (DUF4349)